MELDTNMCTFCVPPPIELGTMLKVLSTESSGMIKQFGLLDGSGESSFKLIVSVKWDAKLERDEQLI